MNNFLNELTKLKSTDREKVDPNGEETRLYAQVKSCFKEIKLQSIFSKYCQEDVQLPEAQATTLLISERSLFELLKYKNK